MRIFASDRVSKMMQKVGMEEGEAIEHPWVNKAIENAQRKVEGRNFDVRKNLLEYDDVSNDQRQVIYQQRDELMDVDEVTETIIELRESVLNACIDGYVPPQSMSEQWDIAGLETELQAQFGLQLPVQRWLDEDDELYEETLRAKLLAVLVTEYAAREALIGSSQMRHVEKEVMLRTLDSHWKEHLAAMDYLRQGIHLRGYAQKNPKQEYKREAFEMFSRMLEAIDQETISILSKLQVQTEPMPPRTAQTGYSLSHTNADEVEQTTVNNKQRPARKTAPRKNPGILTDRKVGRNEPCPCGSGKKYKQCHGKL